MNKKIIIICIIIVLICALTGCGVNLQAVIKYDDNDSGVSLIKFKGTSKEVTFEVPDIVDGKMVTKLEDFSISQNAYVSKLVIGKNVSSISDRAIMSNDRLKEIVVSEENLNFKSVDGVLFTYDMKTLVAYPTDKVPKDGIYTIPDGVEIISKNAFYQANNDNFIEVRMPDSVKRIENRAFMGCAFFKVNISKNCEYIGIDAFSINDNLNKIFIPASVTEIGDFAFNKCKNLPNILLERPSLDGIKCGKKWIPIKAKTLTVKIELVFNSTEA